LTNTVLNGAIIGCGQIAGGLQIRKSTNEVCTHAEAYQQHKNFKLVACIEPNIKRRKKFMTNWNIEHGFSTLDEYLSSDLVIDIISICSSTDSHLELLERLATSNVSVVFCEKPIGKDINKSKRIVQLYESVNKLFAVNYTRRWNSSFIDLKSRIAREEWGKLCSIYGIYSHGIYHYGSHMIDLIRFLFGEIVSVNYAESRYTPDKKDYFCNAVLKLEHGEPIFLNSMLSDDKSIFELKINMNGAILSLENFGKKLRIRNFNQDSLNLEKKDLGEEIVTNTLWKNALYDAYDNIYRALVGDESLACSGKTALITESICSDIVR